MKAFIFFLIIPQITLMVHKYLNMPSVTRTFDIYEVCLQTEVSLSIRLYHR